MSKADTDETRVNAPSSWRPPENLIDCTDCRGRISPRADACPRCGAPRFSVDRRHVTITDVDMSLWTYVRILVYVAIATVPAGILLWLVFRVLKTVAC
jgi:hypothetical protein